MKLLRRILSIIICLCLVVPFGTALADAASAPEAALTEAPGELSEQTLSENPAEQPPESDEAPDAGADHSELYQRLMACDSVEDALALLSGLGEDGYNEFLNSLSDGQYEALKAHLTSLTAHSDASGGSEADSPIIDFTRAAPLVFRGHPTKSSPQVKDGSDDNGLELSKVATAGDSGSYTITIEAFTTGSVTTTVVSKPCDVVLVLDVSGSMEEAFGSSIKVSNADPACGVIEGYYLYDGLLGWYPVRYNPENGRWQYHHLWWSNLDGNDNIYLTRLGALKNSVRSFMSSVSEQAKGPDGIFGTADDVSHRVAVVKFAGTKRDTMGNDMYSGENYSQIVLGLTGCTSSGVSQLNSAVNALAAGGATRADYGMQHANTLLSGISAERDSNRVVVMFTDGDPTSTNGFESNVANAAIAASYTAKNTHGATVYTIGIFDGANGSTGAALPANNASGRSNRFMHLVSSNWRYAESMTVTGAYANPTGSYYLSASGTDSLDDIFIDISDQICSPTISLDSDTVIHDIISPYFMLPAGSTAADIAIYTCDATATSLNAGGSWGARVPSPLTVDIQGSIVNVTGFDFNENFVSSTPRTDGSNTNFYGRKLVIEFTVTPDPRFLGGNNVPTNGEGSGVYSDGDMIEGFDTPTVNVPIGTPNGISTADKHVYLLSPVALNELLSGYTASITTSRGGSVTLQLSEQNFGLEAWQTAYVDIAVELNVNNVALSGDSNVFTDDCTGSVTLSISPKNTTAGAQTAVGTASFYVYKPELTFKDTRHYYGGSAPKNSAEFAAVNLVGERWMHGSVQDTTVTMIGTKPTLTLDFTPQAGCIGTNGTILVRRDIPVNVAALIGDAPVDSHTVFLHESCSPDCRFDGSQARFVLHVAACELTVSNSILHSPLGVEENFILTVHFEGTEGIPAFDFDIVISGEGTQRIVGLPIGEYTVTENGDWSWRYGQVDITPSAVVLSEQAPSGQAEVVNTLTDSKWLTCEDSTIGRFSLTGGILTAHAVLPGKDGDNDE